MAGALRGGLCAAGALAGDFLPQWVVLDLGAPVEVRAVLLELEGTTANPKVIPPAAAVL